MPKNWSKWKRGNVMIYDLEIIHFHLLVFLSMGNTPEIEILITFCKWDWKMGFWVVQGYYGSRLQDQNP